MVRVRYEITKENYDLANETSPYRLIPSDVKMGYGVYTAWVEEVDGKYYLVYDRGSSCD